MASLAANRVWAYNFVFNIIATGQPLKCLTVVDEDIQESPAIMMCQAIPTSFT
jgi:putative transposase